MKYAKLVLIYEAIEKTTKRLEKTALLSTLLKKTDKKDVGIILLLLKGTLYPAWDKQEIGVAARQMLKAISVSFGVPVETVEKEWSNSGDLGLVAEKLAHKKTQATLFSQELTVKDVFSTLRSLSELQGAGTVDRKVSLIQKLLMMAEPSGAKYITRTVLEELRVGLGDGTIRDAMVWTYFPRIKGINDEEKTYPKIKVDDPALIWDNVGCSENTLVFPDEPTARLAYNQIVAKVQRALDFLTDFSKVGELLALEGYEGIKNVSLTPLRPLKVMLAQKVKDVKEGFERVETPCALEYKYDGFRMQIHKLNDQVKIFTRRLEEVTSQFPEVIEIVKTNVASDSILDAEAVGFDPKSGKYLPFQHVSQRIKRKYNIEEVAKKLPVEVNVFDILFVDGKSVIDETYKSRRALIEQIVNEKKGTLRIAEQIITSNENEAKTFYDSSLSAGNEGIMLKKLDAPYKPGSRVGYMVKLKPTMDTLDLVIVGGEWGEGKRAKWVTSFTVACQDDEGNYIEIGKVGTGIKELESEGVTFSQLTELLKPLITEENGREISFKPKVVLEISFEEIQKSPTYDSGYALRFPRVKNLRDERRADDISDIGMVEDLFLSQ